MNTPFPVSTQELVSTAQNESSYAIELGISGLPEFSSDMVSGGLYALNVRTSSARFPLLASALGCAIEAGLHCTIITASAPEDVLGRLETPAGFSMTELLSDGRLVVFSMQDEFTKKIFRYGADRLIQELEDFEVPAGSFVLFEQADDLLSLHDVGLASQQVKVLAKWFKQRQMTGLLAFSRSNEQKLETLNTLMDDLTGIARLGGDRDGLELTFQYWRSTPGVIAAENFRLYTDPAGRYAVSRRQVERAESVAASYSEEPQLQARPLHSEPLRGRQAPSPRVQEPAQANEPHCYLYADPELDVLTNALPGDWKFVPAIDDMLHASYDQPNAMILLSAEPGMDIVALSRTVHALRKTLGLSVQILVREKTRSVSETQKQLFLDCGANVVVAKDIAFEYYPKFLNSLRHQKYSRSFEPDFDAILGAFLMNEEPTSQHIEPERMSAFSYAGGVAAKSEPIAHRAIAKAKRSSLAA